MCSFAWSTLYNNAGATFKKNRNLKPTDWCIPTPYMVGVDVGEILLGVRLRLMVSKIFGVHHRFANLNQGLDANCSGVFLV